MGFVQGSADRAWKGGHVHKPPWAGVGWSQEWEEKRCGTLRNRDSEFDPGLSHYHDGVYLSSLKDRPCFS